MFHLSLPVDRFAECLDFYARCFGAEIVMLGDNAANVFVFGGQVTLHDRPGALDDAQRRAMHFGHVVATDAWFAARDRIREAGQTVLTCIEPGEASSGRGKLLLADPGGNLVEINSALPSS